MSRVTFATQSKSALCIAETIGFCVDNTIFCQGLVCFQHGKVSHDIKREPFNRIGTLLPCLRIKMLIARMVLGSIIVNARP